MQFSRAYNKFMHMYPGLKPTGISTAIKISVKLMSCAEKSRKKRYLDALFL